MRKELLTMAMLTAMLPPAYAASGTHMPEGMCEIVLEAHDVFGNGIYGFQLLLDADHSTYGEIFFNPGGYFFGDYGAFEYRIPENADPVAGTANCVVDGEVSLLIPAGVYDWLTVVPLPEGRSIPDGDYAIGDDFTFVAGKTYRFKAEMRQGQFGMEDHMTLEVDTDYGISGLVLPSSGTDMTAADQISVTVANCGQTVADKVSVCYSINGGVAVCETLPQSPAPGESVEYAFTTKADFSRPAIYDVEAWVEVAGDMLPLNDRVKGRFRHFDILDPPFAYDFASQAAAFADDWIILDRNGDDSTWIINEWISNPSGVMGVAGCGGAFTGDRTGDDWLISQPLRLKRGPCHALLTLRSVMESTTERLQVCVGTSPEPEDMKVVATFEFATEQWIKKAVNFEVGEDGTYYVALHAVSESGYNIFVSDISVDEGEFEGRPEIAVTKVIAPVANCDLPADGKVGLAIENRGTADLKDYTLTCTVTRPDNSKVTVSSAFGEALAPDGKTVCMITESVDFTQTGIYDLDFRIAAADAEANAVAWTECLEPWTELPVVTDFSNDVNTFLWIPMDEDGWHYEAMFNDFSARKHGVGSGLLCRGIAMSHPARVRISYVAGSGWGATALTVLFGKAGEDLSCYTEVFADPNVTNEAKETEIVLPVSEPGNYSVVIADTGDSGSNAYVRLNEACVSGLYPHDLRIEMADGPVAPFMPARHTGRKGTYDVVVTNRGSEPMMGVRVCAATAEGSAGEPSEAVAVAAGESVTVRVEAELPEYAPGDRFELSMTVSADEADEYEADNTWTFPVSVVTEDVIAVENLSEFIYGTGEYGKELYIGNTYSVAAPSALTSVDLGLAQTDMAEIADSPIGLNIYMVEEGRLGRRIFSHECRRGNGGLMTIDMQDMLLPAGTYYFEAAQLSTINFGLGYDPETQYICWMRDGDEISRVQGYALAIRAVFAADSKVYSCDASAERFVMPDVKSALFGSDETVSAVVRNAGSDDAEFDVSLYMDGVRIASRRVSALYFEDKTVEFTGVDLSEPGMHTLECRVSLDGDGNTANDAVTMTLTSDAPLDPFRMDFEGCNDFDAAGDRLNPRWTTEDLNGVSTTFFWRYNHRNRGVPCGFMAYNTHNTVPSMDETPLEGFSACEGDRFGVAFCYSSYAEGGSEHERCDVWMVSPLLQLGDNSSFKVNVKTYALDTPDAELEPFRILVSEEEEGYGGFVVIGDDIRRAPVGDWGLAEADLSDYDNRKVRVAVQYVGVPLKNTCLMIDNLVVETETSGVSGVNAARAGLRYDAVCGTVVYGDVDEKGDIYVFASDGTCVAVALEAHAADVSSLPAGVYVARTGDSVLKFMRR
ncbi:MAG: DUF2436 domain-containing protein [Muribaculaceae bacterium]|nr:DUF2436 domain-containing protein [Muribaculaceae bacterium]